MISDCFGFCKETPAISTRCSLLVTNSSRFLLLLTPSSPISTEMSCTHDENTPRLSNGQSPPRPRANETLGSPLRTLSINEPDITGTTTSRSPTRPLASPSSVLKNRQAEDPSPRRCLFPRLFEPAPLPSLSDSDEPSDEESSEDEEYDMVYRARGNSWDVESDVETSEEDTKEWKDQATEESEDGSDEEDVNADCSDEDGSDEEDVTADCSGEDGAAVVDESLPDERPSSPNPSNDQAPAPASSFSLNGGPLRSPSILGDQLNEGVRVPSWSEGEESEKASRKKRKQRASSSKEHDDGDYSEDRRPKKKTKKKKNAETPQLHCDRCPETFTTQLTLDRHLSSVHMGITSQPCPVCGKSYSREDALQRHQRDVHGHGRGRGRGRGR
ncbi:hypothetical protein K466DRAFT_344339 [Polyporus arcularius HHB13444]|uniref:C2H2-type domain-containing protein n=1 Tax=Polyporus arcularius HHB13444 TaxID=1314778 RepID=A0A5C3NUV4_9APHY|nr:hypothetical protein K466DRAFT_344339 [Polyporus arcularius HHB13444]